MVSESGEEGWSDVVQENAILTSEVEALRRRVKAMQGTIDRLSARNSELMTEKALGTWAPRDGSPDPADCSLTTLVQVSTLSCSALWLSIRSRLLASWCR